MDKKKGVLNVVTSISFRVLILVATLLVRRCLISYIGNEANGLDSLYTSIIGFLSVAELGIGSAITFCMYKPIIDGDNDKVAGLFHLFRRVYIVIGAIILLCGCAIMPAVPLIAKDNSINNLTIYLTYGLMLVSVVVSYAFSAETSLIIAYKNNYVTTTISSLGQILQYVLQIVVLILTQSFIWYFVCRIIAVVVQWLLTELVSRKKYKLIISNKQKIDIQTKKEVVKNVKAMFMHKIGGVLVNTADSLIISAFISVVILGKYSNYTVIMSAMVGTITLVFTPLTSIVGHMFVEGGNEQAKRYYNFFFVLNLLLGIVFFLGYYATIDNLVTICFGDGLEMSKSVSFVITVNYFIQFMRQATLLFRDATGTFYNDRWKPILEGLINIGLSIGFVYLFKFLWGDDFAVVGVIVATIITNLFICHIVEPYVLFKYGFKSSVKKQYFRNYIYILIFVGVLFALHFSMVKIDNHWLELLANGGISLAYSLILSSVFVLTNQDFRYYLIKILKHISVKKKDNTVE